MLGLSSALLNLVRTIDAKFLHHSRVLTLPDCPTWLLDVVLQDFCSVVGTTTTFHNRAWFRNVFDESLGSVGSTCADVSAPLTTRSTPCTLATSAPAPAPTSGSHGLGIFSSLLVTLGAFLFAK